MVTLLGLLVIYLLGNVQISLVHQLTHVHHTTAHTAAAEADACHRAVYHGEVDDGCTHTEHMVNDEQCTLCDMIYKSDQITLEGPVAGHLSDFEVVFSDFAPQHIDLPLTCTASRAPPIA